MAIPESQLDTWSHQGSVTQSKNTYASIRGALEAQGTEYAAKSYAISLQGSYGNDTNVYAESDVDVVIRLDDTFHHDLSRLDQADRTAFEAAFRPAAYSYDSFKADVVQALTKAFGQSVEVGPKAIKIKPAGNRRSADVIAATQFRRYHSFKSPANQSCAEGICFWTSNHEQIVNFPRQHSENCTTKHQASGFWFKPMVRIVKNMRNRLVADGKITAGLAPSYYIEGLLYNVPDDKFAHSYANIFAEAINWIRNDKTNRNEFVCANEQYYLLRDSVPTCWPAANCNKFLDALVTFWNDWK